MPCTDAMSKYKMEVCTKPKGVREKKTFILPVWKEQGTKRKKVLNWKGP